MLACVLCFLEYNLSPVLQMSHASVLVRLNFDKCWLQSKQGESARRGCAHQRAGGCDRSGVTILRPDARSPGGVNAAGEVSPGGVMKGWCDLQRAALSSRPKRRFPGRHGGRLLLINQHGNMGWGVLLISVSLS